MNYDATKSFIKYKSDKRTDIFCFKTVKSSTYSRYGFMNNEKRIRIPWRKTSQQVFDKKECHLEHSVRLCCVFINNAQFVQRFWFLLLKFYIICNYENWLFCYLKKNIKRKIVSYIFGHLYVRLLVTWLFLYHNVLTCSRIHSCIRRRTHLCNKGKYIVQCHIVLSSAI